MSKLQSANKWSECRLLQPENHTQTRQCAVWAQDAPLNGPEAGLWGVTQAHFRPQWDPQYLQGLQLYSKEKGIHNFIFWAYNANGSAHQSCAYTISWLWDALTTPMVCRGVSASGRTMLTPKGLPFQEAGRRYIKLVCPVCQERLISSFMLFVAASAAHSVACDLLQVCPSGLSWAGLPLETQSLQCQQE